MFRHCLNLLFLFSIGLQHFLDRAVMLRTVGLKNLNSNITCPLCGGYFAEATTIMECLHSCKLLLCHITARV